MNNVTIEPHSSLPLADGAAIWPGELVFHQGERLSYVGMLANTTGMMVLERPSGERIIVHHLSCRFSSPSEPYSA